MPPKKDVTSEVPASTSIKPEDAEFFLQCLKAIDDNGTMDMSVLSVALGHTNIGSTRNLFVRQKKRYGLGNILTKVSGGFSTRKGDNGKKGIASDVLKQNPFLTTKVEKTRNQCPIGKMTKSQANIAKVMKVEPQDEISEGMAVYVEDDAY
ncbi:hypothetical protein BGW36DRAFT_426044 [Talaromyces proteolyticus]|uniref:Uncharacterized protein n=1 Tax=Talaromyces proteolyticus TaxID=1131652 RepID=A0AAD4KW69_9EURO|nr:uncharacterized protein BGW36DRAFT_426044 [Talaromyces proteolyticus]KAH8698332.1 hypothetical protein BGW36DRAFT_426044 [Talaromyces proteolyticus]